MYFFKIYDRITLINKIRRVKDLSELKYKRVLLKLSGEALAGKNKNGIDAETIAKICDKIKSSFL